MRGATMMNTIKKNLIGNSPNLLLVAFLVIVACSSPVAHIPEINPELLPIKDPAPTERTYKMIPYDTIMVRFTHHPEVDPKAPVAVRPDGNITLEGIGSVRAAGLTPEELGKEIAAKSSKWLKDPEVIVTIDQFAPRRVYVGGQVKTPGIVEFKGEMTPVQAIFERGGFTDDAQRDSVILIRDTGEPQPIIGRIDSSQSLENGVQEKITLVTNDVIYVPMSGIGRVDLWVKQHLRDILPTEIISYGAYRGS
jgi:protein involved in polysaccharide export with SLBB domain